MGRLCHVHTELEPLLEPLAKQHPCKWTIFPSATGVNQFDRDTQNRITNTLCLSSRPRYNRILFALVLSILSQQLVSGTFAGRGGLTYPLPNAVCIVLGFGVAPPFIQPSFWLASLACSLSSSVTTLPSHCSIQGSI